MDIQTDGELHSICRNTIAVSPCENVPAGGGRGNITSYTHAEGSLPNAPKALYMLRACTHCTEASTITALRGLFALH